MNKENEVTLQPPIEVPADKLSTEILEEVVEEFILREGTDYGAEEVSLLRKKEQVMKQLKSNEIKIVFDQNTETVTLMTVSQFNKIINQ